MSAINQIAIAVLGNELHPGGEVGCEFATRIATLHKVVAAGHEKYQAIYFVGGKPKAGRSEAGAGIEAFRQRYGSSFPVEEPEERSRNSIENVVNLAKKLDERGFAQIDLVSSDYHVDRIRAVDQFMKNQSLLVNLGSVLGRLVSAPYYYERHPDAALKIRARVYSHAQLLGVATVNVEGILQAKELCMFPGVTRFLYEKLLSLHKLCEDSSQWSASTNALRDRLASFIFGQLLVRDAVVANKRASQRNV